ncbi:hypothetical protein HMPREF9141_2262 [Prevotella multiformis DSM 16608]|uniref:Uncharacterized protein n=1 Tax=Prevotella multiformis DSM 16608 TaxID=888743 RepID=F0F9J5_9BACT|nr:hypothetical protein HMPREF9141_2262 [Prevotella multiformis DSM 16608]
MAGCQDENGRQVRGIFLRCQGEDRKAVEMELEWVSGWESVGGPGEILMGIRSGGGWMPEGGVMGSQRKI